MTAGLLNAPEGVDPCRTVNSHVGLALVLVETLEACLAEELSGLRGLRMEGQQGPI